MSTAIDPTPATATSATSLLAKVGPHAPTILLAAGGLGLLSMFLPAVTFSLLGVSGSAAVFVDWRGKLGLLAYLGVGVMAGLMLKNSAFPRGQVLACLITAGVNLLLALWLPLTIRGADVGPLGGGISVGIGCYTHILAALALAAGAAVLAKRERLI